MVRVFLPEVHICNWPFSVSSSLTVLPRLVLAPFCVGWRGTHRSCPQSGRSHQAEERETGMNMHDQKVELLNGCVTIPVILRVANHHFRHKLATHPSDI